MNKEKEPPGLWTGQTLHLVCLIPLLALVWLAWIYLDKPFPIAFWCAVSFPIVHQVFVWLSWRTQLQSRTTSPTGFRRYVVWFFLLFSGRFISLAVLAWLDRGSLKLDPLPQVILTTVLALTGVYAMYSVKRYFGMRRAAGADHFEARYRDMPLVKKGIFRFTDNGMYCCAFLLFWAVAVGFNSTAALLVACYSHAYIWVHFYATEKPDMEHLYSDAATPESN